MNLQSESAASTRSSPSKIRKRLLTCGASGDEAEYLLQKRVELNAMHSAQLVAFIERKLDEHGIKKVIPDRERLDECYRLFERNTRLKEAFERVAKRVDAADVPVPDDLGMQVAEILKDNPELRWDAAVQEILSRHKTPPLGKRISST